MIQKVTHLLVGLSIVLAGSLAVSSIPATAGAAPGDPCNGSKARLLTFPAWYNGLVDDKCNLQPVGNTPDALRNYTFKIVLNIVEILLQLVGYACTVFIIIGGFKYMTGTGDPGQLMAARKTIMNAIIGLVISIASVVIVQTAAWTTG